jgi:ABC-type uncharacterized transport system permease subunit
MKVLYLILGIFLLPFGVFVLYFDRYLAQRQEELHRRGRTEINLYRPLVGPRPFSGVVMVFAGLVFLLAYFLK